MKDYLIPIAIIIGAIIISATVYMAITAQDRNKMKACLEGREGGTERWYQLCYDEVYWWKK